MSRKSRRRKEEDEEQKIAEGEQDNPSSDEMRQEIETMWEIPQIFQFLHLTKESLNVPQFSMYEMERMLLIPRASKQLANIMTCLLSSPITKTKLRKIPPMPYDFWTNILAHKMENWFKVYHAKHKDAAKVLEIIGIEPEFWNVFPDATLLDGKNFENLSFKQRVWLLKTVCDTIMHTRKTVQEDIAKQPWKDQFETVLGTDRYGAKYIYFPQFIPNDLRIYRHCLNNEILSTVKPIRSKQEKETNKLIGARLNKYRLRKLQSHSLSDCKSSRCENKMNEKDDENIKNCKFTNNNANSFISEDINLSNNNISLDVTSKNRPLRSRFSQRISSKTSQNNALSNLKKEESKRRNILDDNSIDDEALQMFKGFVNIKDIKDNNYSIGIINEMLDNLKSEIDKEKKANKHKSSDESTSRRNLVGPCKNTMGFHSEVLIGERYENNKSNDNVFSMSKTDDEKLNEITAEYFRLPENSYSKCVSGDDNVTSKSDDEKLNKTKTDNNVSSVKEVSFNGSLADPNKSALSKETPKCEEKHFDQVNVPLRRTMRTRSNGSTGERTLKKRAKLQSQYGAVQCSETSAVAIKELKEEKIDKKCLSTSNIQLQDALKSVTDYIKTNCNVDYDLQKPTEKMNKSKQHFNKILTDLSVSDFHLVVDSVEGLRDLIGSFSMNDSKSNNIIKIETIPACELKLMTKLTELLSFLETIETTLKDATRKARAKLQREWSNFKEGVEDQNSSSESGLSSNWWVLGSQGRNSLSVTGDATLQTLSQFTLSPPGTQNTQQQPQSTVESEHQNTTNNESTEQNCCENWSASANESQNRNSKEQKDDNNVPSKRNQIKQAKKRKEREQQPNENANNEDAKQTRRVLRTRGISSYTEQFYSDDEDDQNKLERWTDIEAIYATSSAQANSSVADATSKIRHADDRSKQTEDSDQDWILPGSRKRKNKRSPTNRRLKSFQHKVQSIMENASDSVFQLVNAKIKNKNKSNATPIANSTQFSKTVAPITNNKNSERPDAICKIDSVHSELNIKDEVIYEFLTTPNQQNNYNSMNAQQRYYYVMSQNPEIAQNVILQNDSLMQTGMIVQQPPQLHRGYFGVQPIAQTNYMQISNIAPPQPVFSQQNPQLIATMQSHNASYMPHVATTMSSQMDYIVAPRATLQKPVLCIPKSNRCNKRKLTKESPICNDSQNPTNTPMKNQVPRQHVSDSKVVTKQSESSSQVVSKNKKVTQKTKDDQKVTSLIVLSDSDDEIEMIIVEKNTSNIDTEKKMCKKTISPSQENVQSNQKLSSSPLDNIINSSNGISPQIIQRMNQGGISITPIKNTPPPSASNNNTQLVVVVNETGNHYALALPNGSKLILTPEQVAQIRASNGGKLIL